MQTKNTEAVILTKIGSFRLKKKGKQNTVSKDKVVTYYSQNFQV